MIRHPAGGPAASRPRNIVPMTTETLQLAGRRRALAHTALTLGLPLLLLLQGALLLVTSWRAATSGPHTYDFGIVLMGAASVVIGAGALAVVALMLIRNPRRLNGTIEVTATQVLLPAGRRWQRLEVAEVAGVGLGAGPDGTWGLMVWRRDGGHVRLAGPGLSTRDAEPAASPAAQTARRLHRRVLELQGPDGALAREALQRRPDPDPDSLIARLWDPSAPAPAPAPALATGA